MASPLPGTRAAGSLDDQMNQSHNPDDAPSAKPPPSLWPEPSCPIPRPCIPRQVQFNTVSEVSSKARDALEGASCKQQGSAQTECTVSSTTPASAGTASHSSTLPSSYSTSDNDTSPSPSPPSRPIVIAARHVFEPRYPMWHSYPPVLPKKFDSDSDTNSNTKPVSPMKNPPFNPTDTYLQQSGAFQDWVNKKNAARIQLRHGPHYERLLAELRNCQYLAEKGETPPIRANAKVRIPPLKREIEEERQKILVAEQQYIRDIDKGWAYFNNISCYEQAASIQRSISEAAKVEPKRPLSKIERLLGSDGSASGTSSWLQSCSASPQPSDYKMPYEDAEAESTGAKPCPDKLYDIRIPDWFPVAETQGNIRVAGNTIKERYINLLNYIYQLEFEKGQQKYKEKHPDQEGVVKDYTWDKHWHEPNPGWPYAPQKRKGGWWKCRKGPTATAAENKCRICSDVELQEPTPASQLFDEVMEFIKQAMVIVAEEDKKTALERIAEEARGLASLKASQLQLDKDLGAWTFQENNPLATAGPGATASGTRQPFINYNPLIRPDGPSEMKPASQAHVQQMAPRNEGQEISHDEHAGKSKGKEVSRVQPYTRGY
ncbi:hypothetical protein F5Y10DRAFT_5068 [Nemania abortiva]|nr:hypothetical protein F5Y10DRAFT_5068 [Nemania abortiva]